MSYKLKSTEFSPNATGEPAPLAESLDDYLNEKQP